jgi:LysM repeat protein
MFILFLFIILFSSLSFFTLKCKAQDSPSYYINWYVSEGDTLWSIAKESLPRGKDIRQYIIEIRKWNKMDSAKLTIGQKIEIPVYE